MSSHLFSLIMSITHNPFIQKQYLLFVLRMSSIWNYLATLRTGHVYLARSGNEMFGTVIQHGVNQKTVTVRTSFHNWNAKYLRYFNKHSKVQVHDEEEACVTGDKVIVKLCQPLSKSKSYYVKRIVKPFGRDDYYTELKLQAMGVPNLKQQQKVNKSERHAQHQRLDKHKKAKQSKDKKKPSQKSSKEKDQITAKKSSSDQ